METILLADDHAVVRKGLRTILEREWPGVLVAEAAEGLEAVKLARSLRPELVILDLGMPGLNGLEVIRQVREKLPGAKIMVLSVHDDYLLVQEALRRGASAYLLKECAVDELIGAIAAVFKGKSYLSPALSPLLSSLSPPEEEDRLGKLTSREREVLGLLAEGYTSKQIAERLFLSPETVRTHRKHLMSKLDIHNLSRLVKFALDHNLNPRLNT